MPRITAFCCSSGRSGADHEWVLLLVLPLASACALGAALLRRATAPPAGSVDHTDARGLEDSGSTRPAGAWLSLPTAPRAVTVDDDWVLEAFDADEIAELRRIDATVRRDLARDHHALVTALVPGNRRDRRVRAVAWVDGRLILVLGDGTALEFDGVSRGTAVWLGYCQDQFGLVLEAIGPTDTSWAARFASCGVDTPLRASRVRVS